MTLEATVSMGWVNTVIDGARRLGIAEALLLDSAGLPAEALNWERWPIDFITRLWHAAEQCTRDPGFGLKVGGGVRPASIDAVSFAMQSAATLREALVLVQKYQRLISDGGRFQLLPASRGTWIVYHPRQGRLAFSPHQIEAVLSAVVSLSDWIGGSAVRPSRVQFSHGRLGGIAGYREVFGCPVDFEQAFSGLLVANELLDKPLPQANPALARVHERYNAGRLAVLERGAVSAADLRQWLMVRIGPSLPRRVDAARVLGISERTLARRLADEGYTFNRLLDEVRRDLALTAVKTSHQSLADIALSLGFAEASPFYRAFQRWTGLPPAQWRRRHRL
ncbi:AraC family transcriptional regulator [Marinobacter daepoensis]|uniref:AraC family transcriptional regulator n=1 Tax=Marinobacter daepoensis TaxID=262077 RepID=UPI001FD03C6F|nr:AraC family transcriptional regulator [Marinobacter daepoensis]